MCLDMLNRGKVKELSLISQENLFAELNFGYYLASGGLAAYI